MEKAPTTPDATFVAMLIQDKAKFLFYQQKIATEFKQESQRFREIKGRTELTTSELDSIGNNAARNFLQRLVATEIEVNF